MFPHPHRLHLMSTRARLNRCAMMCIVIPCRCSVVTASVVSVRVRSYTIVGFLAHFVERYACALLCMSYDIVETTYTEISEDWAFSLYPTIHCMGVGVHYACVCHGACFIAGWMNGTCVQVTITRTNNVSSLTTNFVLRALVTKITASALRAFLQPQN
jgi:hypothetical protein